MTYSQRGGTTLHSHQTIRYKKLAWHNLQHYQPFRKAFTFEKHSSMGFRSGEYGGIKWTRAPVLWISEITLSVWWIEALSMRRTLCGLVPLKGSKCGKTLFSRKSKNTSSSTDPVVVYTSNIPLSPIVPIAETRFPRQSNCVFGTYTCGIYNCRVIWLWGRSCVSLITRPWCLDLVMILLSHGKWLKLSVLHNNTQSEHDVSRLMSCSDYAIAALQFESPPCTLPSQCDRKVRHMYVADVVWYGAV